MAEQPLHLPTAAASRITDPRTKQPVNAYTLRRWCIAHAHYLSDGANPGKDAPRRLTDRDVEVLRTVAQLRSEGLTTEGVNERLATLSFAVVDNVDNPAKTDVHNLVTAPTPPPNAQEGQGDALLLPVALSSMDKRIEAIERRLEGRDKQAMLWAVGMGVWVGMITMAAIFFAVWLAVNGGG